MEVASRILSVEVALRSRIQLALISQYRGLESGVSGLYESLDEEQAHDIRTSSFSFALHKRTRCNCDVEVESVGKGFVLAGLRSNHLRSSDTDGNMIQAKGMFCIKGLCTCTTGNSRQVST